MTKGVIYEKTELLSPLRTNHVSHTHARTHARTHTHTHVPCFNRLRIPVYSEQWTKLYQATRKNADMSALNLFYCCLITKSQYINHISCAIYTKIRVFFDQHEIVCFIKTTSKWNITTIIIMIHTQTYTMHRGVDMGRACSSTHFRFARGCSWDSRR